MFLRLLNLKRFIELDIWHDQASERATPSLRLKVLRVLSLTWEGLSENQLVMRAAGLSYASLIGLGPMVAMVVMVSGSFLNTDPKGQIKEMLIQIAPPLRQYLTISEVGATPGEATELDLLIDEIWGGAENTLAQINTTGGPFFVMIGVGMLIFVGINLLTSIEKTFNSIWGVRHGRQWGQRIASYWAFLSLGILLGLGSTALFSASALTQAFNWLPFGAGLTTVFITLTPLISVLMLLALLTFGYQFFPNTTVRLRPALLGALIVAVLLLANNYLSILYVRTVIKMQSLYGSLGILLIMMFGLYIFWLLILLGAQVTYAIQNVDFLTHREVWKRISVRTQELVTLAAFLGIARRFHQCQPAPAAGELSEQLRVPGNVLNTSLGILVDNGWVTRIRESDEDGFEKANFRPSMPLSRYNLAAFRDIFAHHGNSHGVTFIAGTDPILQTYRKEMVEIPPTSKSSEGFDQLFESVPWKIPNDPEAS